MLKKVRLHIITERRESAGSLFDGEEMMPLAPDDTPEDEVERIEITVDANYLDDGTRVSMTYHESELTGMQGATTTLTYQKNNPSLVSMLRHGTVKTALVFEPGNRHFCVYQTEIMPFEVCVLTKAVDNAIETEGRLFLDYTVELRGAQAEHTRFQMRVLPCPETPFQK